MSRSAAPTSIHLVRHGQVYNPQKVFYGRLQGFALSGQGRRQARAAAEALAKIPVAALFSSPLLRARQTTEALLACHSGLEIQVSELLNEVYTPFDGCSHSELDALHWDIYTGVDPQYEQPRDVLARMTRFTTQIRRQYAGRHIVAVTHGDPIAFLVLWCKRRPVTPDRGSLDLPDAYPAEGSICTLSFQTVAPDEVPGLAYVRPY